MYLEMLEEVCLFGSLPIVFTVLCSSALQLTVSDQMPRVGVRDRFCCMDSSVAELVLSNTHFSLLERWGFFENTLIFNVCIGNSVV